MHTAFLFCLGDNRIFCGDLGNEVNDNTLAKVLILDFFLFFSSHSRCYECESHDSGLV